MPSISEIFQEVTQAVNAFVSSLGDAMTSVTALFYTPGNGTTAGSFTFLGVLILIGVGVGLVYGCYRLIKGFLHSM